MYRYSMPMKNHELLPGTLDMLVLKTLTRGPNHGYGIAQYIQRVSQDALRIGEGSLYPALQRLLVNDWVRAEWGQSDTGRRVRFYQLTRAGRKQLHAELEEYERVTRALQSVLRTA